MRNLSRVLPAFAVICQLAVFNIGYTYAATPYVITPDSIHKHISILASDSLEGRETGEIGEWKAAKYIEATFKTVGLEPYGDNDTYLQPFEFIKKT